MVRALLCCLALLLPSAAVVAQEAKAVPKPTANSAKEPLAKALSLDRAAAFLEDEHSHVESR